MARPVYLTPEALRKWIPELMAAKKMYLFYHTPEWHRLRRQVLEANHYECEDCKKKSPAVITKATTVHHDKYVEKYPELALSLFYIERGQKKQQLFALCEDCHNARHNRFGYEKREEEKPLTPERW